MCLPATAQVKESTDFRSLKINGHHYLFSTMNADVSYTISVDTAQPELPVVEYDCGNRRNIKWAIEDAVTRINSEKEDPEYLDWQEYILSACKGTKKSLLSTLTKAYEDDSQFATDANSAILTIDGMLTLYDKLLKEITEFYEELNGQEISTEKNVNGGKSYISDSGNSTEQVEIRKASQSSYQWLKEYMWDRCEEWDKVWPNSLALESSSLKIGSEVMVMIQECNDKKNGYIRSSKECLSLLNDSIVKQYQNSLKNINENFTGIKNEKDKQNEEYKYFALAVCTECLAVLDNMDMPKWVDYYMQKFKERQTQLNNDFRNLENLVYEYIDILNIYTDFYAVFPERVIEYSDWLQSISDMVMAWEADDAAMMERNGGILEFPSSIVFDGVEYIVFKIEDGIPWAKLSNVTVKLPSTIQYLSDRSFYSEHIDKVESLSPIPPIMERPDVFYFYFTDFNTDDNVSNYDKMTLVVPDGCIEAYVSEKTPLRDKNGYWWYLFKDIKTFSEVSSVEAIDAEVDGIRMQNGVLVNENGMDIAVYDISGRIIYTGNDRQVSIPQKSLLIVKAGTKTIKIRS